MKIILLFTLVYSFRIFSQFIPNQISEIDRLDLLEFRDTSKQLELIKDHIKDLESNDCILQNDSYNECSKPFALLEELLNQAFFLEEKLLELKEKIYPFLDEKGKIFESIAIELEDEFPIALTCPKTDLTNLIENADSMLIFTQRLKKIGAYEMLPEIPNVIKRDCDGSIKNKCWQIDMYGNIFYITEENLKISYDCLIKNKLDREMYEASNIIKSANIAIEALKTCFTKLNPIRAKEILNKIDNQEYMMFCKGQNADAGTEKCGYTNKGLDYFNLVFTPMSCENIEETIFHEILHMNSNIDNLDTHHHNNPDCRKHDSIYFCARTCFPNSVREKINFTHKACSSCIKNSNEISRCKSKEFDEIIFDQSYFNCEI